MQTALKALENFGVDDEIELTFSILEASQE
jgi:hypothetical protein